MILDTMKVRWVFTTVVLLPVVVSQSKPRNALEPSSSDERLVTAMVSLGYSSRGQEETTGEALRKLEYDFYRDLCPEAENIVRKKMAWIYRQHRNVSAQLLRLFFHDCFIEHQLHPSSAPLPTLALMLPSRKAVPARCSPLSAAP